MVANSSKTASGFVFEQFGVSHNAFLKWMEGQDAPAIQNAEQYVAALSYVDDFFGSSAFNAPLSSFLISVDSVESWSDRTLEGQFNSQFLVNQKRISNEMGNYLNRLAILFYEADAHVYTPEQFTTAATGLEDWVVANNEVTIDSNYRCNDGAAMLAITSIAKHSYSYWYNKFVTQQAGAQARGIGGIFRAIKVAACDAFGFVYDGWVGDGPGGSGTRNHWDSRYGVEGGGIRSHNASF